MDIKQIFAQTKTIAIVGLSDNPVKASYGVAQYLMPHYNVIPVNPRYDEILGLTCYPDLQSIPVAVDMVNIFQRSENIMPFVQPAIKLEISCFWMQLGIGSPQARTQLEAAGIAVVEDKCTKIEHGYYC
ncbi:MAG: CoA-binding protein [Pseudomonadales bacterium]|nr:CoA-binding protein [Pseudomonadales bacterium]